MEAYTLPRTAGQSVSTVETQSDIHVSAVSLQGQLAGVVEKLIERMERLELQLASQKTAHDMAPGRWDRKWPSRHLPLSLSPFPLVVLVPLHMLYYIDACMYPLQVSHMHWCKYTGCTECEYTNYMITQLYLPLLYIIFNVQISDIRSMEHKRVTTHSTLIIIVLSCARAHGHFPFIPEFAGGGACPGIVGGCLPCDISSGHDHTITYVQGMYMWMICSRYDTSLSKFLCRERSKNKILIFS